MNIIKSFLKFVGCLVIGMPIWSFVAIFVICRPFISTLIDRKNQETVEKKQEAKSHQ